MVLGWVVLLSTSAQAWWKPEWTIRKKITVDTGAAGIKDPVGTTAVLVRLHEGNFQFAGAREDGSDIRFVAADDKTVLKHHVEKFDSVLYEAFVWVQVPDVKPEAQTPIWLYYGNAGESVTRGDDAKGTYDGDTVLVYHFAESGAAPADASGNGNTGEKPGIPASGAQIGGGLRLTGQNSVTIPVNASLAWTAGAPMTWSAWIKPAVLQPNAVIFSRREGTNGLVIGSDNGVPFVEVTTAGAVQRSAAGAPLTVNTWKHLAVVAEATKITLYLDGETYATLAVGLPALNSMSVIGKDAADAQGVGFTGEIDEMQLSKVARPAGFLKVAATGQVGGDKSAKLVVEGQDEMEGEGGGGELAKHLSLITDISKSLTFDGWVVIVLCAILAVVGWGVSIAKFFYLNRIQKATTAFMKKWEELSSDLSVIDHSDVESVRSMGGQANPKVQRQMSASPLYHIYQIGSSEIQHRLSNARHGFQGLSGRSIHAIKATLDGGLVREVQKLNSSLVFLTIGIAGGPYLGLLGTVIGVMITFAVIAKSGEVEVNSIAPGIAGALLATVAGLVVAIPALFAYSYISSRIKDAVSDMQIFIDEFVAKIAEVFPAENE
jgi:biopolymer transport protein ExbB